MRIYRVKGIERIKETRLRTSAATAAAVYCVTYYICIYIYIFIILYTDAAHVFMLFFS